MNALPSLSSGIGVMVVIANVLLDQIGLPVPALPTLIVAGAVGTHDSLIGSELFIGAVLACLIPDIGWYLAGRVYGSGVMKTLCRISLNPDSCVSQTQLRFERWGPGALLVAKFVPGLSIIAPPLAGATHMGWVRFTLLSSVGAMLWIGAALAAGRLLEPQIESLLPHAARVGSMIIGLLLLALVAYVALKWQQRRRFYAALRMARIGVDELYALIEAGAAPLIIDVRSQIARTLEPRRVPGALAITLQQIAQQQHQLPRDRDIVLYCSCPNEASAAQVAKVLIDAGFERVRPLRGGLEAWIAAGYAAESIAAESVAVISTAGTPSTGI